MLSVQTDFVVPPTGELRGVRWSPENFLMPNPAFGGNLGQKINWSRSTWRVRRDLPERFSVSVPPVVNDICRSAVPAPKYLPERHSTTFPHHYTPGNGVCSKLFKQLVNLVSQSHILHCLLPAQRDDGLTIYIAACDRETNTQHYALGPTVSKTHLYYNIRYS